MGKGGWIAGISIRQPLNPVTASPMMRAGGSAALLAE